jgi:DNA-binding NtrC family response regulator/CHASE2 domain-containing sensor protein
VRHLLAAALITVLAVVAAVALVGAGGRSVSAIEWTVRDTVLPMMAAPVSPSLVIVARDAASEARFGTGAWDRAVLARMVNGLARAGATAIGLDVSRGQLGAPGRGGAASDALLAHATATAGNVVLAVSGSEPVGAPVPPAQAIGHTQTRAEGDGVVRRPPLVVRHEGREVVAFGVALAAVAADASGAQILGRIPTDAEGVAFLRWAPDLPVIAVSELWTALESGEPERLRRMVDGKAVLVLSEPVGRPRLTPIGPLSDVAIQAEILNAVQTGAWLRAAPHTVVLLVTATGAGLAAWLGLAMPAVRAMLGVALVALVYAAAFAQAPATTGLVLPFVGPLTAILTAGAAALGWRQVKSARRLRGLEHEVDGMRDALVRHESMVETLEDDLEAARATVARSTGAERELLQAAEGLRQQVAEAHAQEAQTRARLEALERERREATPGSSAPPDAERERLRRQAEAVGIVSRDPAVLALFRDLQKASRTLLPILLLGEPGTGKELFARATHRLSPRAAGPFVAVNTAAIPPELFESELFGHVRGAFTGAVAERKGHFEQADRGTLFLDEIGELRAEHQGKLLRVLQEGTFHRVGATRPTTVDVRIVAASNRDLARGVAEGWFREDLYFRLRGLVLRLPALRERQGDTVLLAERFLADLAPEAGRRVTLSEAAARALARHAWPGNVRELQSCLRRAVALSERDVLTSDDLALQSPAEPAPAEAGGDDLVLDSLRRHGFDMQGTARALGWDRSTVTQRLKGLGFQALVEAGGDRGRAAVALAGRSGALARAVELKLAEYHGHLVRSIADFESPDAAVAACRRRFRNLPERYFGALETLVRQHFE